MVVRLGVVGPLLAVGVDIRASELLAPLGMCSSVFASRPKD